MLVSLGIESTAHTFGVGIVDENGRIYANEKITYTNPSGGIHPREASEFHLRNFDSIILKALDRAGFVIDKKNRRIVDVLSYLKEKYGYEEVFNEKPRERYLIDGEERIYVKDQVIYRGEEKVELDLDSIKSNEINLISVAMGPGLFPTLSLGIFIAKVLSLKLNVPIMGVNHCVAHVEIAKLVSGFEDPVVLYVSGANTQIIAYEGGKYRIFGETLDMGVGNFIDSVGRLLGLGFPAGPKIEELAKKGKELIELPYTVKGMDIQLSGIYTYIKRIVEKGNFKIEDLAFSIQEHVFAMLVEITERALAHLGKKEVLVTGGVAANKRLQEMIRIMAEDRGVKFKPIPIDLATDNGAMIAWAGIVFYKKGVRYEFNEIYPRPYWRTDQV